MKPHDQFAKNYLEQLLSPLGTVEISKEVSDETRQIDLFFSPNPEPNRDYLGLLGRIVLNTVLIEPYRNPPNRSEIRNCLAKLLTILAELQRQAKRENQSYNENNAPRLWILSPSAGITVLEGFGAKLEPECLKPPLRPPRLVPRLPITRCWAWCPKAALDAVPAHSVAKLESSQARALAELRAKRCHHRSQATRSVDRPCSECSSLARCVGLTSKVLPTLN